MNLYYIGHSGFAIETDNVIIIIDLYEDNNNIMPGILANNKPIYFLCSHSHPDHYNPIIFSYSELDRSVKYILSNDIKKKVRSFTEGKYDITFLKRNEEYVDDLLTVDTFGSTDIGVSFLITLEGRKIFHAGDLNNWCWEEESTEKEIKMANGEFLAILNDIKSMTLEIYLAMFPVDPRMGGDFAKGARQFVNMIKVFNFVPMHMWGRENMACDFSLYKNPDFGNYICMHSGDEIKL